jgi:hypothetical protein
MKNNKGYYGWIHSLNKAGLHAQQNGRNMLNEAKGRPSKFPANLSDFQYDPKAHAEIDAAKMAGGEEGANIQRRNTQLANFGKPVNMAPIGDANAERDQHDEVDEMLDTADEEDAEMADFLLQGRQAREIIDVARQKQRARWAEEDKEVKPESPEDKYERDQEARRLSDYSGRTGEVYESLSQKINRILKG